MAVTRRDIRLRPGRAISSVSENYTVGIAGSHTFLDIAGMGGIRFAGFFITAKNDSHKMWAKIHIDGVLVEPNGQFLALSQRGYDANTTPLAISTMTEDGICNSIYVFVPELTFDKSLKIEVENWSAANTVQCMASWTYYVI